MGGLFKPNIPDIPEPPPIIEQPVMPMVDDLEAKKSERRARQSKKRTGRESTYLADGV